MSQGFMGKKVNLFLLLMLLLLLLGLAAASIYYQHTLKNVNQEIDNTIQSLAVCEQNLTKTADSLIVALRNLNSTSVDIRKYDLLYEQKASELEGKSKELTDTRTALTRAEIQREVYKKQIDEAYSQIIAANSTITSLQNQIVSLNREIDRLNTRVSCLRNTPDNLELTTCFN